MHIAFGHGIYQNFSKKISSKKNLILEKKMWFEGGKNAVEEQKMSLFSPNVLY